MSENWTTDDLLNSIGVSIAAYGEKRYQDGMNDGLQVAVKIKGWLTRQPDRKWQAQVRQWADAEIAKARAHSSSEKADAP